MVKKKMIILVSILFLLMVSVVVPSKQNREEAIIIDSLSYSVRVFTREAEESEEDFMRIVMDFAKNIVTHRDISIDIKAKIIGRITGIFKLEQKPEIDWDYGSDGKVFKATIHWWKEKESVNE